MRKKGALGEQMTVFIFIFFMVIIGGGIVIGTYAFVGAEIDYKGVEANLLGESVGKCISNNDLWIRDAKAKPEIFYSSCRLNKEITGKNNKIKICINQANNIDCIGERDEKDIAFSTGGDFEPCGFEEAEKFLGCSITHAGEYVIIATSTQKIRRSAK